MADLRLLLDDVSRAESLPEVCVRCGRKAAGLRGFRLRTSEPKRTSPVGCLMVALDLWTWRDKWHYENVLHELKVRRGKLKLPVCWRHRWLLPPLIGVGLIDERTVALSGVSDAFTAEMRRRGWAR